MYSINARRNEASPNRMSLDRILAGSSTPSVRRKSSNADFSVEGLMAVCRWNAGHPQTRRRTWYPDHEEGSARHGGIRSRRRSALTSAFATLAVIPLRVPNPIHVRQAHVLIERPGRNAFPYAALGGKSHHGQRSTDYHAPAYP